ncbi:peptide/nickel transport system permease protein [Angulomicrobium tetraedrale]|uniref:Peptide/nickel transport system permease protein n=2 Tax=Ancylobacter tetraedralis TaxID=217068 RepID=A0A839ZD91_9HYPH|nr:peptide/nickel transport system permease protein [Ancylobacter tetraedralis]
MNADAALSDAAPPAAKLPPSGAPMTHYVATGPFDPNATEPMTKAQERVYLASQLTLMWWKFRRHRLALISGIFLLVVYFSILFCEFLAPYDYQARHTDFIRSPPQGIHLFHEGSFIGPFTYGLDYKLDLDTLRRTYTPDESRIYPVRFFCRGDSYRFWGLIEGNLHLMCPGEGGTLFLLGTDRLGRDMLSRMIYGARISLTIGLIGVAVSFSLGIVIGGLAGYYGGIFDLLTQRAIEVVQSLPHIPLWLALSAIMPPDWSPILVYFGITVILGLMDWTGLARAVRSKLLSLREDEYVVAAQLMGARTPRIVFRHLVPGFMSHLIAMATIAIPGMILGETALSFLGLGLRPPITSWGVMLNEAQNINIVVLYPWLILPVVPVICVILAFNFLGDGLRDAADPYR